MDAIGVVRFVFGDVTIKCCKSRARVFSTESTERDPQTYNRYTVTKMMTNGASRGSSGHQEGRIGVRGGKPTPRKAIAASPSLASALRRHRAIPTPTLASYERRLATFEPLSSRSTVVPSSSPSSAPSPSPPPYRALWLRHREYQLVVTAAPPGVSCAMRAARSRSCAGRCESTATAGGSVSGDDGSASRASTTGSNVS